MENSKNIKWELEQYNDGELIGLRVLCKENGDTLFDTGLKGCIYEEEEENAKLIAAAPEMLGKLEKLLSMYISTDKPSIRLVLETQELIKKITE